MHGRKTAFAYAAALFGLTTLFGCSEEPPEDFGTVRIEMSPLAGNLDLFAGTVEVVATVHYQACLQDFYLNRQPTYQKDGPDGAPLFEEWAERLCTDFSKLPECEVVSINQTLLPENDIYTLSVKYKIKNPSTLAYRELHVGPLPVEDFAGCGNDLPTVKLQIDGLLGRDINNQQLWRISALPGRNAAVANQGAPLRVELMSTQSDN